MAAMTALAGKRILVTRPRAQAAGLCARLAALGAEPIVFPTIEITPLEDTSLLDQAVNQLSSYHWVIFTSVNGVRAFWERLEAAGKDARAFDGIRVAAIGPATAKALKAHGVVAQFMPAEYVAEAIVEGIGDVEGRRILLPRAGIAREVLARELARRGAVVDEIAAYRTLAAAPDPDGLGELQRGVDAITFTSSSTVRNFVALAGREAQTTDYTDVTDVHSLSVQSVPSVRRGGSSSAPTHGTVIACIGPVTASTAHELGLRVDVVATEYTIDGLVQAIVDHFASEQENAT